MTISVTQGIASAMMQAMADALMDSGEDGAELRIYAGVVPQNAAAAVGSAVVLCKVRGPSNESLALELAGGILQKDPLQVWAGDNLASGTATFFRIVNQTDTDGASVSAPRVQGRVGLVGSDLNLTNTSLVQDAPQDIKHFVMTLLEAQGA